MATTTHPVAAASGTLTATRHNPLTLWHLLSLDAPTVAALWTWFLASENHIHLPATAIFSMALAVWMLYATDRLLDARASAFNLPNDLEPRHHFHRLYRRAFRLGILISAIALAFLLPALNPQSIRLYLVLGALLIAYFLLIHVNIATTSRRLPKEIAVGIFFSAATFIPTVSRQPALRSSLLPAAILFALVCSLNCLFIYAWEHPTATPQTHPATRIALRFLPALTIATILSATAIAFTDPHLPWPIPAATSIAAILLFVLHRHRARLSPTTLRAAADLCLLTPLLILPIASK